MSVKRLSLVFSFKNEEENIPELVKRVEAVVDQIKIPNYEMIFVDDASTDNSLALLCDLASRYPILVIRMSRTFGTAPCVLAGFEKCKGDLIVYMDSDLQDPPELIAEMYKEYLKGYDVVHATRTSRSGEPALKLILTKIAYRLINIASDIKLRENTGDFKMLSRKAVDKVLLLDEYDPFMRGLSVWIGLKQTAVFYEREKRFAGETKFPIFSANPRKEFLRGLTSFSDAPLILSVYVGTAACLFAVFLIIYALVSKLFGFSAPGSSSIIAIVSFFSGAILVSNGILGFYISKIFFEVKRRPKYIVDKILDLRE